jgi:hypothetical protein
MSYGRDSSAAVVVIVGAVALFVAILAYDAFVYGIVLSNGWWWFVVPLGVPPIGRTHAAGIAVLIAVLTQRRRLEKAGKVGAGETVWALIWPWTALAIMAVLHGIMR